VVVVVRGVSVGRVAAAVAVRSAACATSTIAAAATTARRVRVERVKERKVASGNDEAVGGGVRQGESCAASSEQKGKEVPALFCRLLKLFRRAIFLLLIQ
jgi:hypothetical protein